MCVNTTFIVNFKIEFPLFLHFFFLLLYMHNIGSKSRIFFWCRPCWVLWKSLILCSCFLQIRFWFCTFQTWDFLGWLRSVAMEERWLEDRCSQVIEVRKSNKSGKKMRRNRYKMQRRKKLQMASQPPRLHYWWQVCFLWLKYHRSLLPHVRVAPNIDMLRKLLMILSSLSNHSYFKKIYVLHFEIYAQEYKIIFYIFGVYYELKTYFKRDIFRESYFP